jgi:hypothetical protein
MGQAAFIRGTGLTPGLLEKFVRKFLQGNISGINITQEAAARESRLS